MIERFFKACACWWRAWRRPSSRTDARNRSSSPHNAAAPMRRQWFRWPALTIELAIMPENSPFIERDAAFRGEIGGDPRAFRHTIAQRNHARHFLFEPLHPLRKGVAQAFDDLEQREVDIAEPATKEIRTTTARDHLLEIAKIFRHATFPEISRAALSLRTLLLVIERARDRVMRVMDLPHQIRDGELQLVRPQLAVLVLGRKPVPRTEIEQDICGLTDAALAGLEERRRKRRMRLASTGEQRLDGLTTALARYVKVVRAGLLQRKADEFAAALDARPIVKLVAHGHLQMSESYFTASGNIGQMCVRQLPRCESACNSLACRVRKDCFVSAAPAPASVCSLPNRSRSVPSSSNIPDAVSTTSKRRRWRRKTPSIFTSSTAAGPLTGRAARTSDATPIIRAGRIARPTRARARSSSAPSRTSNRARRSPTITAAAMSAGSSSRTAASAKSASRNGTRNGAPS